MYVSMYIYLPITPALRQASITNPWRDFVHISHDSVNNACVNLTSVSLSMYLNSSYCMYASIYLSTYVYLSSYIVIRLHRAQQLNLGETVLIIQYRPLSLLAIILHSAVVGPPTPASRHPYVTLHPASFFNHSRLIFGKQRKIEAFIWAAVRCVDNVKGI